MLAVEEVENKAAMKDSMTSSIPIVGSTKSKAS
jgi:hypothetical protein